MRMMVILLIIIIFIIFIIIPPFESKSIFYFTLHCAAVSQTSQSG